MLSLVETRAGLAGLLISSNPYAHPSTGLDDTHPQMDRDDIKGNRNNKTKNLNI